MDLETLKEKPIFQMTGGEFLYLQKNVGFEKKTKESVPNSSKKYIYGIRGIAKLFSCSISSANRIKKSGIIDKAIIQNGRKIIVDSEMALELLRKSK